MNEPEKIPFFTNHLKTATKQDCEMAWLGKSNGEYFRCAFCGFKFKEGDKYRVLFTNDLKGAGGNPIMCEGCDVPNDLARELWKCKCEDLQELKKNKFWWFFRV